MGAGNRPRPRNRIAIHGGGEADAPCVADRAAEGARDPGPSAAFSPRGGLESSPFVSSLAAGPV